MPTHRKVTKPEHLRGINRIGKKHWPKKPGTLVYFGGGVHEVLADGYATRFRNDLGPNTPARLWKPKWAKRDAARIKKHKTKRKKSSSRKWPNGTMHKALKIPEGKKISIAALRRAAKGTGKTAKRAVFLLNVRGYKTGKR